MCNALLWGATNPSIDLGIDCRHSDPWMLLLLLLLLLLLSHATPHRFRSLVSTQPRIILGTASSSRRFVMDQLVKDYSFSYDVIKADIDEKAIRHEQPQQLVLALAHAKADAIIQQLQQQQPAAGGSSGSSDGSSAAGQELLITCDQVVVHDGQIREKPEDVAEAHR